MLHAPLFLFLGAMARLDLAIVATSRAAPVLVGFHMFPLAERTGEVLGLIGLICGLTTAVPPEQPADRDAEDDSEQDQDHNLEKSIVRVLVHRFHLTPLSVSKNFCSLSSLTMPATIAFLSPLQKVLATS